MKQSGANTAKICLLMLIEQLACWLMPKAKHAFLVPAVVKMILVIL